MKIIRVNKVLVCLAIIALALVAASYLTTNHTWTGAFPTCEVSIQIVDEKRDPIRGAWLVVLSEDGIPLVRDSPFLEKQIVSNHDGLMTMHQIDDNKEFGGSSWQLLWFYRIGARYPSSVCQIIAAGYKPKKVRIRDIFKSNMKYYEDMEKLDVIIDGKSYRLPVYRHVIDLEAD